MTIRHSLEGNTSGLFFCPWQGPQRGPVDDATGQRRGAGRDSTERPLGCGLGGAPSNDIGKGYVLTLINGMSLHILTK